METEIFVDLIVKELEKEDIKDKKLWDICTGSGCIGISIKKNCLIFKWCYLIFQKMLYLSRVKMQPQIT